MTDRIDHAAEARKLVQHLDGGVGDELVLGGAVLHAVLALVEQQRRVADFLDKIPRDEGGNPIIPVEVRS